MVKVESELMVVERELMRSLVIVKRTHVQLKVNIIRGWHRSQKSLGLDKSFECKIVPYEYRMEGT